MSSQAATDEPAPAPELVDSRRHFQGCAAEVRQLVADLSDDQFNRRPASDQWSISECLDHLCTVAEQMIPRLKRAVAGGRERQRHGRAPFRYGTISTWLVKQMGAGQLPPRRRLKAPSLYGPKTDQPINKVVPEFVHLQNEFVECIDQAQGLDLASIKVASPVTRLFRLSLGQWFTGLAGHQERHLWQARQVKQKLRESGGETVGPSD